MNNYLAAWHGLSSRLSLRSFLVVSTQLWSVLALRMGKVRATERDSWHCDVCLGDLITEIIVLISRSGYLAPVVWADLKIREWWNELHRPGVPTTNIFSHKIHFSCQEDRPGKAGYLTTPTNRSHWHLNCCRSSWLSSHFTEQSDQTG